MKVEEIKKIVVMGAGGMGHGAWNCPNGTNEWL